MGSLVHRVSDQVWLATLKRLLDTAEGASAREKLRDLEAKAARRNLDRIGFRELLFSGLEDIVFRRYLTLASKREAQLEISNAKSSIHRLTQLAREEFKLPVDVPPEKWDALESPLLDWRAKALFAERIRAHQCTRQRARATLAAYNSRRNKYPKQDTWAITQLRAGLLMFVGSQHDHSVAVLLAQASRAAGREHDVWSASKLEKASDRFAREYEGEVSYLLVHSLELMEIQLYPAREDCSSLESWWPAINFIARLRQLAKEPTKSQ